MYSTVKIPQIQLKIRQQTDKWDSDKEGHGPANDDGQYAAWGTVLQ